MERGKASKGRETVGDLVLLELWRFEGGKLVEVGGEGTTEGLRSEVDFSDDAGGVTNDALPFRGAGVGVGFPGGRSVGEG